MITYITYPKTPKLTKNKNKKKLARAEEEERRAQWAQRMLLKAVSEATRLESAQEATVNDLGHILESHVTRSILSQQLRRDAIRAEAAADRNSTKPWRKAKNPDTKQAQQQSQWGNGQSTCPRR